MRQVNNAVCFWVGVMLIANLLSSWSFARDGEGIQTPTGNIHCIVWGDSLRCDMKVIESKLPPHPKDCDLDWGDAFGIEAAGLKGERLCHGDTAQKPSFRKLPYGELWITNHFVCSSEKTGLTCKNKRNHGFTLSRTAQKLF
jgi:hypothetical protein